jgi:hypothetical protein
MSTSRPHDSRSDVPQDGDVEFGEAGAANETNPTPIIEARVVLTPVDRSGHLYVELQVYIKTLSLLRYHSKSERRIFDLNRNGRTQTSHQPKRTTHHPPRNQAPRNPHSPLERPPNLATRQHPYPLWLPTSLKLLQQIHLQPHTPAQRDRKHLHSSHRCFTSIVRCRVCLWFLEATVRASDAARCASVRVFLCWSRGVLGHVGCVSYDFESFRES